MLSSDAMVPGMLRPTAEQLAVLGRFERLAFELADTVNRRPTLKRAAHGFLRTVGREWVHVATRNLQHVACGDIPASLRPDRGVLLVANHRSFFDLYVVSSVLLRNADWVQQMYFPVRSTFFYEGPAGVAVNAVMSALAMYPPVMRGVRKRAFNRYAVDVITELLAKPGVMVGYHPEGRRATHANPYQLLPAGTGTGEIIWQARPIVLPVFVLGLCNDIRRQVRGNFDRTGDPVTVRFGAPLDLTALYAEPASTATFRRIANAVRNGLSALGEADRELRLREGLPVPGGASLGDTSDDSGAAPDDDG